MSHALAGLAYGLSTQPNFQVHLTLSILSIIAGTILKLSPVEWTILFLVIGCGLAVEFINTSIESAVDLITDKYHLQAKIAKDTAAAALLIYAITAIVVAFFLFIPKIVCRFF